MDTYTFATSRQIDFPVCIKMYVTSATRLTPPGLDHDLSMFLSKLTVVQKQFGRKTEVDTIFDFIETFRTPAYWISAKSNIRASCDGSVMGRVQATGSIYANAAYLLQA